jgi:hypothetical protein
VLRALASVGVFAEDETGQFGPTSLAETLQTGAPGSLRDMAIVWGEPWHWQAWGSLLHGVQTGDIPWNNALGMSLFEYFMSHPAAARDRGGGSPVKVVVGFGEASRGHPASPNLLPYEQENNYVN